MHNTPSEFLVGVLLNTLVYVIIFLAVKRFTKLITPKVMKVIKYLLTLYVIAVVGSTVASYYMTWNKPQSFQQGLKLIENNPRITSKIGKINGYLYSDLDMPSDDDDPARLILTLNGRKGDMYIDVLVTKDKKSKKWSILEFKKDSLIRVE